MEPRRSCLAVNLALLAAGCAAAGSRAGAADTAPLEPEPAGAGTPPVVVATKPARSIRLQADGGVSMLGFDASSDGAALAVRHAGPLTVGDQRLAGDGTLVTVVRFDAAGKLLWTRALTGGAPEIASLRVGDGGAVALSGAADSALLCDGKTVCRPREGRAGVVLHLRSGDYDGAGAWTAPAAGGAVTAVALVPGDWLRWAGVFDVDAARAAGMRLGPEPHQAYIGDKGGERQRFGSDQPIRMTWIEPGPGGLSVLLGSFAGSIGGGGKPAIGSPRRTGFVVYVGDDGRIDQPMALPLPDGAEALEPVLARVQGCFIELLGVADGAAPWWYRLRGGYELSALCPLGLDDPAAVVRGMDVRPGAAVVAARVRGEERAFLFDGECRAAGSLAAPPGLELHGVRFAGAHLVTALAGGGAVELQWFALSPESSSCGGEPKGGSRNH